MPFGRYNLFVNHEKRGDFSTLAECWEILEDAYAKLPDPYGDYLHWEIHDPFHGAVFCKFDMAGGTWNACCETPKVFAMYLELVGWDEMTSS